MYNVLVVDKIDEIGINLLKKQENIKVDVQIGIKQDEVLKIIQNYDALIIRSDTKIDKELLDKAKKLKIVGRAGKGTDNIDIKEATSKGVIIANTPDSNTISACEIAIALMLSAARHVPYADKFLKEGNWGRDEFMGTELFGKTIGIIGLGRIGSLMATRMKSFGMNLIAYDPYINDERFERYNCKKVDNLEDLITESDIITIHTPKTDETLNIIDEKEINIMKDNVILINAARGKLINEEALLKGLDSGKIRAVGLDVHSEEPRYESPLYKYNNVVVTPHIGATTYEAQENVGYKIAEQVINALNNEVVETAVNLPTLGRDEFKEVKPYISLLENLGKIYYQLNKDVINSVTVDYYGDISKQDLSIVNSSFLKGLLTPILKDEVNYINSNYLSEKRGINSNFNKKEKLEDSYPNLIKIKIENTKGELFELEGIIDHNQNQRILSLNKYNVDVILSENMLVLKNNDVPGVIGKVGEVLGKENINIATMYVGRKEDSALMILTVDDKVNSKSLENISKVNEIKWVKFLEI